MKYLTLLAFLALSSVAYGHGTHHHPVLSSDLAATQAEVTNLDIRMLAEEAELPIPGPEGPQGIQGLEGPIGLQGLTGALDADLLVEVTDLEARTTTLEAAGSGEDLSGSIIVMDRYLWAIQKVQAEMRANVRTGTTVPGDSAAEWIAFLTTALGDNPVSPVGGQPPFLQSITGDSFYGQVGIDTTGSWGGGDLTIHIARPIHGPLLENGQVVSQLVPLTSYLAIP